MKTTRILLAASLALLGVGCGGAGQTGKVSVLLKDAPGPFTKAIVTISEVDLVGSGGTTLLTKQETTTDLLTLANDTADLVKDADVPVGTYGQLRFVITGAYVEVNGVGYATSPAYAGIPAGAQVGGTLRMPSFAETGLKVDLPGGAVSVGTASKVLLVDFDVSQSFGQDAGASGAWVMNPVVHATELELSGTVDVAVALAQGVTLPGTTTLADFNAVLTPAAGGDALTVPLVADASGKYGVSFKYLLPGAYALGLAAPSGVSFATTPALPEPVTVTSGQATAESIVVTSAAATAAP